MPSFIEQNIKNDPWFENSKLKLKNVKKHSFHRQNIYGTVEKYLSKFQVKYQVKYQVNEKNTKSIKKIPSISQKNTKCIPSKYQVNIKKIPSNAK